MATTFCEVLKLNRPQFKWYSEVRDYELDLQGVVYHATYLKYFDCARSQHLKAEGVDWVNWHEKGFDFVLIKTEMSIKASLVSGNKFIVTSTFKREGRIKIIFSQKILRIPEEEVIAEAKNTIVCVKRSNKRVCFPEELAALFV